MDGERLITVVVPQGTGQPLLHFLSERQVIRAALGSARAPLVRTRGSGAFARTIHSSVEKDILQVVVSRHEADEIFELLMERAQIAETPGGFMYMGLISRASSFALDSIG